MIVNRKIIKFSIFGELHKMSEEILYNSANIADAIKIRAKERNVQLKTMLADLDLGVNTMSNLRHGRMIATDSLARIADYLDCSVDSLLGREKFSPPPWVGELNAKLARLTPENAARLTGYLDSLIDPPEKP